jgi:hypothetical protein
MEEMGLFEPQSDFSNIKRPHKQTPDQMHKAQ